MVLWQKPLTIPSWSKFYHRSGIHCLQIFKKHCQRHNGPRHCFYNLNYLSSYKAGLLAGSRETMCFYSSKQIWDKYGTNMGTKYEYYEIIWIHEDKYGQIWFHKYNKIWRNMIEQSRLGLNIFYSQIYVYVTNKYKSKNIQIYWIRNIKHWTWQQ